MLILILISIVVATPEQGFEINRIESNPGLYFEQIHALSLYNTVWKLYNSIDLRSYKELYQLVTVSSLKTNEICNSNREVLPDQFCYTFTSVMNATLERLKQNDLLVADLLATTNNNVRNKRGAVNIIGGAAKLLFGTLDAEDGAMFNKKINYLEENQNKLIELSKYQVSTFESAMNALNTTKNNPIYRKLQTKLEHITDYIEKISNSVNNATAKIKLYQTIDESVLLFDLLANHFSQYQGNLLEILINAHQGIIHPLLLSPAKLVSELQKIQNLIPTDSTFPVTLILANSHELYKLLKLSVYRNGEIIYFIVRVPLTNRDVYDLVKVTSLPVRLDKDLFSFIVPSKSYLVIDNNKQQFFQTDIDYVKSCITLNEKLLCEQKEPLHFVAASENCEISIYSKSKISESCDKRLIHLLHPLFVKNEAPNSWIFAAPKATSLQINCKFSKSSIELNNTGILNLQPKCVAYADNVILQSFNEIKQITNFITPFIPKINMTEAFWKSKINFANVPKYNYSLMSNNLISLSKFSVSLSHLKDKQKELVPNVHDVHHYVSIYVLLIIFIIVTIVIIVLRKLKKEKPVDVVQPTQNSAESVDTIEICSNPSYKFPN
ncbi:uncharacterized protein [Onthophagus taurus]|uniref:uncharacterized protein n=1 Tax=Onthophagus taurus TaxID=166361 RepID=UPI0039BE9EBA